MNVRKTLTTAHARRCSAAAVAGAAAALLLTPSTAFAAGHPAGGERPGGAVVGVGAPASAGVGAGVGEPATSGHTAGSTGSTGSRHTGGSSNAHSANHPGHPAHHATANHSGHKPGTRPGHTNGHLAGHPTAARAGAHKHKAIADDPSTSTDPTPHSDHTKPKSDSSTGKPPKSTTPKTPKPGGSKSSDSGPMATITKLSMSKNPTSARPLTMSARVSLARRAPGAPKESGTVTFTVDGASSGPIPMTNNRASVKVKITPGKHTAIAKYSGDKSHSPSDSGPLSFTVS